MSFTRANVAILAIAVALLTLTMAHVPDSFAANPPQSPRTEIKLLTPFGVKGLAEGLQISEKVSGKCFAASAASPTRPDAWRCNAGNAILDPCYQRILGDEKQLACPVEGPWSQKIVLLTLTDSLANEPRKEIPRDSTLPWAIELANGKHCSLFTGATAPVAGMRINYGCPGGFQVVGDIDRSSPVWRVFFQAESASVLEQVEVAVAWY
jgi:hypothetical protein